MKKQTKTRKSKSKSKISNKKISIKDTIIKIVDVVKKPFQHSQPQNDNDNIKKKPLTGIDQPFAENSTITQTSKFFYSNEKFIDTFDDFEIYKTIVHEYPDLLYSQKNEQLKKQAIIAMIDNDDLMNNILNNYNMTVLDFFRFLFRMCPSLFKGLFVKKIQKTLKHKKYAKSLKFPNYRFQSNRPTRKRRRSKNVAKKRSKLKN